MLNSIAEVYEKYTNVISLFGLSQKSFPDSQENKQMRLNKNWTD